MNIAGKEMVNGKETPYYVLFSIQRCCSTHQRKVTDILLLAGFCSTDVSVLSQALCMLPGPAQPVPGALDGEN